MSDYLERRKLCEKIHRAIPTKDPPKKALVPDTCEKCRWRCIGRPCVMPKGVCGL